MKNLTPYIDFSPEFSDEEKMKRMLSDEDHYTNLLNILMNDLKGKWYEKIGKYLVGKFGKRLPNDYHWVKCEKDDDFRFVGIAFMTGSLGNLSLNAETMQKLWGNPIFHDNFGEGGLEDFEEDSSGYASYFKTINGLNFHIGYDHRGTGVEVMSISNFSPATRKYPAAEDVFNAIKLLVDEVVYLY